MLSYESALCHAVELFVVRSQFISGRTLWLDWSSREAPYYIYRAGFFGCRMRRNYGAYYARNDLSCSGGRIPYYYSRR
jgi:hypothetical protein